MALIVEKGGVENISPVMIPVDGTAQLKEIFKLYGLAEKLFIGPKFHEPLGASDREREKLEQQAECIKPVEEWLRMLDEGVFPFAESPHICRNPFSGEIGQTLKNMQSMRSDSCVCTFKFAVGELDSLPKTWKGGGQSIPMDEQAAFWLGMDALGIPVSALISSGGKSVHAWLRMDCPDRAAWDCDVEQGLFACILKPLGLDSSCQNESRLSRTPGHLRAESGRPQTLIYLNLEAGK